MRYPIGAALMMVFVIASGCAPKDKCGSEQRFYEPVSELCFDCPKNSTLQNGTCVCNDDKYEFKNRNCVLKDGETVDAGTKPEDDSGTGSTSGSGASCSDYCDFAKSCIGNNTLAQSALPTIISGLHADDAAACTASCQSDLGNEGSGDPVIACIKAGSDGVMCEGGGSQQTLTDGLSLVGDCCTPNKSNALCKAICATLKANPLTANAVMFCD